VSAQPGAQRASSPGVFEVRRTRVRLVAAASLLLAICTGQASALAVGGTTPASTHYAAVFRGDATGRTDVTSALRSFLQSHNGQRVALARHGIYRVSRVVFTAHDLTVDFRGARLQGSVVGSEVLKLQTATNVVLNDPKVYGTGYVWNDSTSWEHGIDIDGGSGITLNHPVTRDTRGDGIYVGYSKGYNSPAVRVRINHPNVARAARNGISPVAGQVTIRGGHIAHTGLMSIDFEVNDATGAGSIRGVVDGTDIRSHGDLPATAAYCTCWAVAAEGASSATKPSISVQNLTGDDLRMTIKDTATVIVRDNVSDTSVIARFPGSGSVTFSGNVRITRQ
jgi:hypothetical protein